MRAGAAGVSFARNVFSRENPTEMIENLKAIVHAADDGKWPSITVPVPNDDMGANG